MIEFLEPKTDGIEQELFLVVPADLCYFTLNTLPALKLLFSVLDWFTGDPTKLLKLEKTWFPNSIDPNFSSDLITLWTYAAWLAWIVATGLFEVPSILPGSYPIYPPTNIKLAIDPDGVLLLLLDSWSL